MPVPTVEWWQKKTTGNVADRKNPLITDIDILLREYHTAGKTDVQKQKILILILYYCTTWLVTKGEKKSSWRRKYVEELETAIKDELRSPTMTNATDQRIKGTGGVHMKEDAIEVLQPRDLSKKFGLQAATLNYDRMSADTAEGFISKFQDSDKLTGYALDLQQEMNSGNPHDYVDSLKMVAASKATGKVASSLTYLSKKERVDRRLRLWPTDGCFHRGGRDTPYQTAGPGNDIFAMDQMELIYVGDPKFGRFHHSTFMSGKPVLCAGEIQVGGGKITYISNQSGHYMPNTQELLACVEVLERKYNADLNNIKLDDAKAKHEWKSAKEFQARRGVPPKIGAARA